MGEDPPIADVGPAHVGFGQGTGSIHLKNDVLNHVARDWRWVRVGEDRGRSEGEKGNEGEDERRDIISEGARPSS